MSDKESLLVLVKDTYIEKTKFMGVVQRLKNAGMNVVRLMPEVGSFEGFVKKGADRSSLEKIEGVEFIEDNQVISVGPPDSEVA